MTLFIIDEISRIRQMLPSPRIEAPGKAFDGLVVLLKGLDDDLLLAFQVVHDHADLAVAEADDDDRHLVVGPERALRS